MQRHRFQAPFACLMVGMTFLGSCANARTPAVSAAESPRPTAAEAAASAPVPVSTQFAVPENAGSPLALKKPMLFVSVEQPKDEGSRYRFSPEAIDAANAQIESVLPRIKRFTIYSIYNINGVEKAREMSDQGQMKEVETKELGAPDLYLNIKPALLRNLQNRGTATKAETHIFRCVLVYNVTDSDRRVLDIAKDASDSIEAELSQDCEKIWDNDQKKEVFAHGFNPDDPDNQKDMVQRLSSAAMVELGERLGKAFPVTTLVTGLAPSKTAFAVSRGSRHGIFTGQPVTIWVQDGSFAIPIAAGTAESTVETATVRDLKWNESDPDAKSWVDKVKSDPEILKKQATRDQQLRKAERASAAERREGNQVGDVEGDGEFLDGIYATTVGLPPDFRNRKVNVKTP